MQGQQVSFEKQRQDSGVFVVHNTTMPTVYYKEMCSVCFNIII